MANDALPGPSRTGADEHVAQSTEKSNEVDFGDLLQEVWGRFAPGRQPSESILNKVEKPIALKDLAAEKQSEILTTLQLQANLGTFAKALMPEERSNELLNTFEKERGQLARDSQLVFDKLPTFGPATKELYSRLATHLAEKTIPDTLLALHDLQLTPPGGLEVTVKNSEGLPLSYEALIQAAKRKQIELDINPANLDSVPKLEQVLDWLRDSDKSLQQKKLTDSAEAALSTIVEAGIAEGRFPPGWRRDEKMDKSLWCSAVVQAIDYYQRKTSIIEAVDHLNRSSSGFKSDALQNLPEGVSIVRDAFSDNLVRVDFGKWMVTNLELSHYRNQTKLAHLDASLDRYEVAARNASTEFDGDPLHMAGFGEVPMPFGWVDPKTWNIDLGQHGHNDTWKKFNLLKIDTDVQSKYDAAGQLKSIVVTPRVELENISSGINYLNMLSDAKFAPPQKSKEYKPDEFIAVQTGFSAQDRMLIKARDLSTWLNYQKAKKLFSDAVTVTMDTAMLAEGGLGLVAGRAIAKAGVKDVVSVALRKEASAEVAGMANEIAKRQLASSIFKLGIGASAVLQGNQENPILDSVTEMRHKYFFGMGALPLVNRRVVRDIFTLAKGQLPELASTSEKLAETIRGSRQVAEYSQLAETGGLIKAIRGGKQLQGALHAVLGTANGAFIGEAAVQTAGILKQEPVDREELKISQAALLRASQLDHSAIAKALAFDTTHSSVLQTHLLDYKKSLGPLSNVASEAIDSIIHHTVELSGSSVSESDRQQFIQGMIKHFRYSGEQIHKLSEAKTLSEAALNELAAKDTTTLDPNVRQVAALAALLLSQKEQGGWPDILLARTVNVPPFRMETSVAGSSTELSIDHYPKGVEETVTSAEALNLLRQDLHESNQLETKQLKSAVLYDVGLASGELYGSILIDQLKNHRQLSKDQNQRNIIELGRLISELKLEEEARPTRLSPHELDVVRGWTGGLSSRDLKAVLERVSLNSNDADVSATASSVLRFLDKQHLDETDTQRFNEILRNSAAHITSCAQELVLRDDLRKPATTAAEWERKSQAIDYFARLSISQSNEALKEEIKAAYTQTITGPNPELAVRAFKNIVKTLPGSSLQTDDAETSNSVRALHSAFIKSSVNALNNRLFDVPAADANTRVNNAIQRIELINALAQLPSSQQSQMVRPSLLAIVDKSGQPDPFEGVRIAALKALSSLGAAEDASLIKFSADARTEPAAAVRLQAIDTLENLALPKSELNSIMKQLAKNEKDVAALLQLAKYSDADGSILERSSARSKKERADAKLEQQREVPTAADVERAIPLSLRGSASIFSYLDESASIQTMMGPRSLLEVWNEQRNNFESRSTTSAVQESANHELIQLEARAQEKAFLTYGRKVDALAKTALSGDGYDTDRVEFQHKQLDDRESALLILGNLVSGGTRMGKPFTSHRYTYDPTYIAPRYKNNFVAFSDQQRRWRAELNIEKARSYPELKPAFTFRGQRENVALYESDPWPKMEAKIATKLTEMVNSASAHLPSLTEQLLRGLRRDSGACDATRTILVNGLEQVLNSKHSDPESRRYILTNVSQLLKELPVSKGPQSLIAMLDLIDHHAKKTLGENDLALLRESVSSRLSSDTPPEVRTRAHQLFNRVWDSVLDGYDRLPAPVGTRQRANILPSDIQELRTRPGEPASTTRVDDAVDRIFHATKGQKIMPEDSLISRLRPLAAADVDEKVRLAACIALIETGADTSGGVAGLMNIAINSDVAGYRDDALAVLKRHPESVRVSADALSAVRSNLLEAIAACDATKQDSEQLSNADLITKAQRLLQPPTATNGIAPPPGSDKLRDTLRETLHQSLRKFGSALLSIGTIRAKMPDANPKLVLTNLRDGLDAYELAPSLKTIDDSAKRQLLVLGKPTKTIDAVPELYESARQVMFRASESGDLPHIVQALNAYAELTASQIARTVSPGDIWTKTEALLSLSSVLTRKYLPADTQARADSFVQIAKTKLEIGASGIRQGRILRFEDALQQSQAYLEEAKETYRTAAQTQATSSKMRESLHLIAQQQERLESVRDRARKRVSNANTYNAVAN